MNKALALVLGKLIQVAYAQLTPIAGPMPTGEWVIETTLHVAEFGMVPIGFVASCNGDSYLVLRGTATPVEWIDDARIVLLPWNPGGHVTAGDYALYAQLWPQIAAHLKTTGRVIVTGHSLGAAVALLIAAELRDQLKIDAEVYTFCGPRCSDAAFAQNLPPATFRIFNTEDAVPTLPYAPILYTHVGQPVAVTFNTGNPVGNHAIGNVLTALEAMP